MKTLKPSKNAEETRLIHAIAKRAVGMCPEYDFLSAVMDITAGHQDIPLDLAGLLAVDDYTFSHDVFGINRHLNRETLKIENCFVPRCAARYSAK